MSDVDLAARAAEMKAKMDQSNPANLPQPEKAARRRIPMTTPQRRLYVAPIPGYEMFWILGKPERIAQAENAFYEFVTQEEVEMNDKRVGADLASGSTDLGSWVSVVAGDERDSAGQPIRLYLMKVRREYYEEDMQLGEQRNSQVAEALTASYRTGVIGGAAPGELGDDSQTRYVDPRRTTIPEFFKPKRRA